MMNDKGAARFDTALTLVPRPLRQELRRLTYDERCRTEELRLRTGRPVSAVLDDGERSMGGGIVTRDHIDCVLETATRVSAHTAKESIRAGFITAPGGFRVGLCGRAVISDGQIQGMRELTSVVIRIPREIIGLSDSIFEQIPPPFRSTLIVSPPGLGKTTLLRDMVRRLSDDGTRVSLCDERQEVAAGYGGRPQMDVGVYTDVLEGCPKRLGIPMLLRAMNPQIIAIDEITHPEDSTAIIEAANCGAELLATAHAWDESDLAKRPIYRELLVREIFKYVIIITKQDGKRSYEVKKLC